MSRSDDRSATAADRVATTTAPSDRPSCRSHPQRGRPRRSLEQNDLPPDHRVSTLPFSVSKVVPPLLRALFASGSDAEEPSTSLRRGAATGPPPPPPRCCCATLHTFCRMPSVFLWP